MFKDLWLILLGIWRRRRRIHGGLWWRSHDSPRPDVSGTSPSLVASNSLFGTFGNLSGATVTHALKRRIKYSLGLKLGLVSIPGTALGALSGAACRVGPFQDSAWQHTCGERVHAVQGQDERWEGQQIHTAHASHDDDGQHFRWESYPAFLESGEASSSCRS